MPDSSNVELEPLAFLELGHLRPVVEAELGRISACQADLQRFCDFMRHRLRCALSAGLTIDDVAVELQMSRDFVQRLVDTDDQPALELTWKPSTTRMRSQSPQAPRSA